MTTDGSNLFRPFLFKNLHLCYPLRKTNILELLVTWDELFQHWELILEEVYSISVLHQRKVQEANDPNSCNRPPIQDVDKTLNFDILEIIEYN